jgi:hypothetical protein
MVRVGRKGGFYHEEGIETRVDDGMLSGIPVWYPARLESITIPKA